MFEELEETRYPFESFGQFLSGGYWAQLEALHLTLGWLFVLWLIVHTLRAKLPTSFLLSVLYFALTLFTNPAYDMAGLKVNEICGVLATLFALLPNHRKSPTLARPSPPALGLLLVFFVGAVHNLVVGMLYPALNAEASIAATRVAVNVKILVLACNLMIVGNILKKGIGLDLLIKACLAAGTFGLCMYLLQGVVLAGAGTMPFGTFIDAGYIGVPSFGSVSIERGHLGKFMAPLFPFFLYALLAYRWRWRFLLFVLVSCINFSASGQVFFATFSLLAMWEFRAHLKRGAAMVWLTLAVAGLSLLVVANLDVFEALGTKIYDLAIQGDESTGGGRSVGTFMEYMTAYPFGIGYGGSTLRTAPGLPEINAAHFAFVAQYSLLAAPILLGYLWLVWKTVSVPRASRTLLLRTMSVGVIGSMLIFAADILWFVPTIWLAYEIAWARSKFRQTEGPSRSPRTPQSPVIATL